MIEIMSSFLLKKKLYINWHSDVIFTFYLELKIYKDYKFTIVLLGINFIPVSKRQISMMS